MRKIQEIIDTTDHVSMQLEKAHSVLNEICAYFVREDERSFLPIAAAHINNLLLVVNDYILDATGAARSAINKAESILDEATPDEI